MFTAELLHKCVAKETPSPMLVQAITSNMTLLLCSEGDRRRARFELQHEPTSEPASVQILAEYRSAAGE